MIARHFSDNSKGAVLFYGDSNTWGYNPDVCSKQSSRFEYHQRWTTLVGHYLHNKYQIIAEGLNARTTVYDDVCSPCDGEYDCNGRRYLTTILHTHKPLRLVVLALGTNDLKSKFHASAYDIVGGIRSLIKDVQKASDIGPQYVVNENGERIEPKSDSTKCDLKTTKIHYEAPKILVLGPPVVHATKFNRTWGFDEGVDHKSRKVSALLLLSCKEFGVEYINLGHVSKVSEMDGVHFPLSEQPVIAKVVADKIAEMLK